TWLQSMYEVIQLPVGRAREAAFREKLQELDDEIRGRFSDRIFDFYRSQLTADQADQQQPALPLPAGEPGEAEVASIQVVDVGGAESQREAGIRSMLLEARQFLRGRSRPQEPGEDLQAQVQAIVAKYQPRLIDWDIRFGYLRSLLQLYETSLEGRTTDISRYVKTRLEAIRAASKQVTTKTNVLAGGIMGALSSIIVALFKGYQKEILDLVGSLVK
ncbi:MAG: hypothetical protein ACRD24_16295, partial [Terriglobales bacterium]